MYHSVGTPIDGDTRFLYNVDPRRFETHMRYLAERHAGRLMPVADAPQSDSLTIGITFDDGYRDNLVVAAPLLARLSIPFTVFVATGPVASGMSGFLAPEQVRDLAGIPGATIGAHGVSHRPLTACDDRALREELTASKKYLEDLIGRPVDTLSYPHGAVDRRVRDMAETVGYRIGASSRPDVNGPRRDPLVLCRTGVWTNDDLPVLEEKVRGDWDWARWRSSDPAASH
jgi:peptidoglycan/xylan/chitin deacetylase (PgdA/CDA1 family)